MCHTVRTSIACEPAAVRTARVWVREQLAELYRDLDAGVVDDAGLAISELVTNCVRADAHELTVTITAHRHDVVIATVDDADGMPHVQSPGSDATNGRGLRIVDAVTTEWGVSPADGHKTVWGRFDLNGATVPAFSCDRQGS